MAENDRPVFYFDLNSPYAWLAAERINSVLPVPPVWRPIAFAFVLRAAEKTPWSFDTKGERADGMREVERRAAERGLPEVRWPKEWPVESYSLDAMRAATYSTDVGKVTAFSLAAFRQMFNAGRPLSDMDNVLLAAAACELHPKAVLKAVERESVKERLKEATDEAIALGVTGVPTVRVGDELYWGDDRLEEAAAALE